ncbi:efflux RND transporter permease subunit [Kushneria phosphatilytica]|uniref:Efflux RND transporter permease subunit n=1 Tax=Kushneria phosphatilytica TaxID=657387 RepID=A0A1S1NSW1_9GAMM|nr:efflux RND transporter permease subunit [Kushneria phosphatilytica]OHV08685.1 hypothetical protein BH688_11660 [Kushneria phosphatilytica]QEL12403.1 efflux RND transporter permease subunit [Kushneria phosphatilytica]
MKLADLAVQRPVATAVASTLLVLFGVLAFLELPIREYPAIEEPEVTVEVGYPGASAAVVESRITQRVEDAVSGIEGLRTIESESEDGEADISLIFTSDTDLDTAANDVRDRVGRIVDNLPDQADPPEISKDQGGSDTLMVLALQAESMSAMALSDYADRYLLDRFSTISGVSRVRLWGAQLPTMRIELDRQAMAARDVTVEDVADALARENVEYPGGRIESATREFSVRLLPGYERSRDFESLVVHRGEATDTVTLNDIARVRLGPDTLREAFEDDGNPIVAIAISRQSTANTLAIAEGVYRVLDELKDDLPEGLSIDVRNDDTRYIAAALHEVSVTLAIAVLMVVGVIIAFLGSWRAALVAAVAIPVSLLASGIVLLWLGFSLNLLTLLALVLAVGLVVDDAIVMVENIQRHLEAGDTPLVAAWRGARQVAFAILATSLVLSAVFLPITLMSGQTGRLFTEFAVTIVATIAFSTFVSLTLTPMLASCLLRLLPERSNRRQPVIDRLLAALERRYAGMLQRLRSRPLLAGAGFMAITLTAVALTLSLPGEYEPYEDRGSLRLYARAEEGTNFEEMVRRMHAMGEAMGPALPDSAISNVLMRVPTPGNSEGAVNVGRWIVSFAPWHERRLTTREVAGKLRQQLSDFAPLQISTWLPEGLSSSHGAPVQFVLGGPSYETLKRWQEILMPLWERYPGLEELQSDYVESTPQLEVRFDRARAAQLGVNAETVGEALETFFGGRTLTTFERDGQSYDVLLQGQRNDRLTPEAIGELRVRTASGELVRLDNLVNIREVAVSRTLNRYNRLRAITFSANTTDGYALSEVLEHMRGTVEQALPDNARVDYKGASQDLIEAGRDLALVFTIALLVTWLVLAAQFESLLSPLVVMLTVPLGLIGASTGLVVFGQSLSLYAQIGLLILIGLAAKNGILIVEFANQLRDHGHALSDAVIEASRARLRPILMTSVSTMAGALPLLLATGPGANSRLGLGVTLFFGCASAGLLTLIIVPLAYQWLTGRQRSPGHRARQLRQELDERHREE